MRNGTDTSTNLYIHFLAAREYDSKVSTFTGEYVRAASYIGLSLWGCKFGRFRVYKKGVRSVRRELVCIVLLFARE